MDLSKLPASILVALGFVATAGPSCTATACLDVGACLSPESSASDSATDSATSTGGGTDTTGSSEVSTSACLDVNPVTSEGSVGPCLQPPDPTSGGETDTDTGGETDTDGGTSSGGAAAAPDRQATIQKFSDALPKDVLARLRSKDIKK